MFNIVNTTTNSYIMMHSSFNGASRVTETVNRRLAKTYSKKQATAEIAMLELGHEFKKYAVKKVAK